MEFYTPHPPPPPPPEGPENRRVKDMAIVKATDQADRDEQAFKKWKRGTRFLTFSKEKLIRQAARDADVGATRYLISKSYGESSFMWAILENEETVVKTFIEAGYNLERKVFGKPPLSGETPLMAAIKKGRLLIGKILIEAGADVNGKNSEGSAPLNYAAWKNAIGIVELLIEKGADLENQAHAEPTPLMRAASWGHLLMTKILIEAGADINIKGEGGRTVLEWAQELRCSDDIIIFLKDATEKKIPVKGLKSRDQWVVSHEKGSGMVIHIQYNAASTISVTDVFNFSTGMLLSEFRKGDELASLVTTHFKDLEPAVMEQAENKLTSTPKPKPARFRKLKS